MSGNSRGFLRLRNIAVLSLIYEASETQRSSSSLFRLEDIEAQTDRCSPATSVISFSEWPLTLSIKFGIGFSALSVVAAIVLAVLNICGVYTHPLYYLFPFNGLIGGLLMVFKGISDMYLHKTYEQVKARPEYVIDKKINL